MNGLLSDLNPIQQGAVILTLGLLALLLIVLPAWVFIVMPVVDFVRVRLGLQSIGDSRTWTQIEGSEVFQRDAADRRAAKATQQATEQQPTLAA